MHTPAFVPDEEARDHRGSCAQSEAGDQGGCARWLPEEIAKETLVGLCIRVHEDPDGFPLAQCAEDMPRGFALRDEAIPAERAIGLNEPIEPRIIQRPNEDGHRVAVKRMGEGTQLPRAEVGGEDEHAPPLSPRAFVMLETLVSDKGADGLVCQAGKLAEFAEQAPQVPKGSLEEGTPLARGERREDEREIAMAHLSPSAAQIVSQKTHAFANGERPGSGKMSQGFHHEPGGHVFEPVAHGHSRSCGHSRGVSCW